MRRLLLAALLVAGCAQLPPSPQDLQAKKFEAVPGMAVIYIVRNQPDLSPHHGTLTLDDTGMITTFPGTYYRWEVAPGSHRIRSYVIGTAAVTLQAEAGKIYFVQNKVSGFRSATNVFLEVIPEGDGRAMVVRSQLIGS